MELRHAIFASLVACSCPHTESRSQPLLGECLCPCAPDAAIDAPPDAPALVVDPAVPWTRTVITPGTPTGLFRGADGVAEDVDHCWATAWEEGGIVTRACPINGAWQTEVVATGLPGVEDAKCADLDGDGSIDCVSGSDSGARVYVTFREPLGNTTITLSASMGHGRVMQVALADLDGDGNTDVLFGTRLGSPSVVAALRNPGPANARIALAWEFVPIVPSVGWIMSLVTRDVNNDGRPDVIFSDRTKASDGTWTTYGAHWVEQMSDATWQLRTISLPAGSCSPYTAPSCSKTPGDAMMLDVTAGGDVLLGASSAGQVDSRLVVYANQGDWLTWVATTLPPMPNVGHYQHGIMYDVNHDGTRDYVVTSWKGNAYPVQEPDASKSGVYWIDGLTLQRGEISGPTGGKYDNVARLGASCIITSEQLDPEGGLGVVEYCPPGAP